MSTEHISKIGEELRDPPEAVGFHGRPLNGKTPSRFHTKRRLNRAAWSIILLPMGLFILLITAVILSFIIYADLETVLQNLLSKEIHFAIYLSLSTSVVSTCLCILVAVPTAYFLVRKKFYGKPMVEMLFDLPMTFPPLVSGVGLLILLGPILGNYLATIGLKFIFTTQGIIISQFFVAAPFSVRLMKATYNEIDPRYEEVGRTLKASHYETFFRITLPLAKKGVIGMASLTWARILGEFGATMMLVGATRFKTETLPNALYLNMTDGNLDMVLATCIVFLLVGVCMLSIYTLMTEKKKRV